jgi:hypothetical protein
LSKRRRIQARIETPEIVQTIVEVAGEVTITTDGQTLPVPKRYTPPNCSACQNLRPKAEQSYVSVYHTRREAEFVFHYCKCGFCSNTFKHIEKI